MKSSDLDRAIKFFAKIVFIWAVIVATLNCVAFSIFHPDGVATNIFGKAVTAPKVWFCAFAHWLLLGAFYLLAAQTMVMSIRGCYRLLRNSPVQLVLTMLFLGVLLLAVSWVIFHCVRITPVTFYYTSTAWLQNSTGKAATGVLATTISFLLNCVPVIVSAGVFWFGNKIAAITDPMEEPSFSLTTS
ncbi:MAG: hypothetical protein K2W82_17420 [Candidatus Obscuribacterales bacterium]|nr:hypothetical protein [Candidatus Obscuribacterales bacterium]